MLSELHWNLAQLSDAGKNFSFDLSGKNNVIITGFDKKTGKFEITLIDQIYPGKEHEVLQRTLSRKRKKS